MRPVAIVAGVLAGKPGNGGHAWSRISLVHGLRRLGFDAVFVEQLRGASEAERRYFELVCEEFDIDGDLIDSKASYELVARAESAALLVNVGGHLTVPQVKHAPRRRVYLDDDPAYTQLWHHAGLLGERLLAHDFYFTFGENIGRHGCALPVDGIQWRPTRPSVVLEEWPVSNGVESGFTTVASWRGGYGRVEHDGTLLGQKAHEFRRFASVPRAANQDFEVALAIEEGDCADVDLLRRNGWRLVDPTDVAGSPDDFKRYIQRSGAEFSPAQGIYVATQCGWFSDRTTKYLASGKPALVQDTGFTQNLEAQEGLVAFTTLDEAVARAKDIAVNHEYHAAAARAIAEKHFDSDKVLGRMLEQVGV